MIYWLLVCGWYLLSSYTNITWGGGYQTKLHCLAIILVTRDHVNVCYILNIMFMFNKCRRSEDVVTLAIFRCDLDNLTDTFVKGKLHWRQY